MSADQLNLMEHEGMSIASHCKTHSFLTSLDPCQTSNELHESKAVLEAILAKTIHFVSFPGGRYNKTVIECARQAGYSGLFSSEPFGFKPLDFSSFLVGRFMVKKSTSLKRLAELVSPGKGIIVRERCIYFGKSTLKKIVPMLVYKNIWNIYIRNGQ
jgi:peptidoglycan/xylan/chitin deacetylase (PgdA/CDA1 family)